jgi:GntR family transcriptional regulator, transcriptional repressor for pyruvate dehydrogenase complex
VESKAILKNLRSKDIREQVFEQLLGQITTGVWNPGDKLPSENELASLLGVSRISVREAIRKLSALYLVETFQGKGTFVKEFTATNYLKSLTPMLLLSRNDIRYIIEYRKLLDVGIIDLYLKNVKESDIARLQEALDGMVLHQANLAKYKVYDLRFHVILYEMTENPFILKITNMIHDILDSSIGGAVLTEKGAEEGIEYHSQILKCIRERNKEGLETVTRELFDLLLQELKESAPAE